MSRVDLVDLARTGPVHFMGIGGAGMCALSELLVREGGKVSGCDLRDNEATRRLAALGAEVTEGHDPAHIERATALVVTSAVAPTHPEVARARELGLPVLKRAEALGALVNRGRVVAVAGTHGKTTTTAMAVAILTAAGQDPTGFVGGTVTDWSGNLRHGGSVLFVVEADEYDRSFLTLEPNVAVVTNLEADHLDVYGDLEGVRESFFRFASKLRPGGRLIACADDPGASSLLASTPAGYSYGFSPGAQLRGVDPQVDDAGVRVSVVEDGVPRGRIHVTTPGRHNLLNALGATAAARAVGAPWGAIVTGLGDYRGVERRFERLGEAGGVVVVDDYAHHPTEIRATIVAARSTYPGRRVVAVFQPHLYSRTRDFAPEFGRELAEADVVWVTDVFPAREEPLEGVTGELVSRAARRAGATSVHDHASVGDVHLAVAGELHPGDVLLILGAGSVEDVGPRVLALLRRDHG